MGLLGTQQALDYQAWVAATQSDNVHGYRDALRAGWQNAAAKQEARLDDAITALENSYGDDFYLLIAQGRLRNQPLLLIYDLAGECLERIEEGGKSNG